ncbi:MAG: glycosyltransferase [Chloroflexota bacterium]
MTLSSAVLRAAAREADALRGVRVVIDARPMQEPERGPLTAEYLDHLLAAFAREPLDGESFVVISRALRPDPSDDLERAGLPIVGRRRLPPTSRAFRSAGMTLDSFLLRGAEFGATTGDDAEPAVFHTAGGAVPVASRLPIVATLLDLAPWELPGIYASSAAARFGHRLRARVLRDATRVIVCSRSVAETARRRLHLPAERLAVVPLAVDESFRAAGRQPDLVRDTRERLALPDRYLLFAGRYDARKDMRTLFEALRIVRDRNLMGTETAGRGRRASGNGRHASIPAFVFAVAHGAQDEFDLVARAIDRSGVSELVKLVVPTDATERAQVIAGAEAFVYPALSEATALPVLEALSLGVPVVCTRAGALPEVVASAGIVVAPRDPNRLAAAIEAVWEGGSLAQGLRSQAHRRAEATTRTWSDVARETREVYAAAARTGSK